ncbi:hypothetical protein BsWGS_01948 [Bradybaena similaris]
MLAHNGLALITEKLQRQRLEEFPPVMCDTHVSQVVTSLGDATSRQQAHLTMRGKNVWTPSQETARRCPNELSTQDTRQPTPESTGKPKLTNFTCCRHEQLRHFCGACDKASGVAAAPPKKKRCRSLSGPPECQTVVSAPAVEYNGQVWKPIAVVPPQSGNNTATTRTCESNTGLPHTTIGFNLLPAISSHRSTESGCYTNSGQTSFSDCNAKSSNTSAGSPIPRPASAASDTSFSSIWQDCSTKESRVRILENRSLSCEDQISESPSVNPTSCHVQDKSNSCTNSVLPRCHSQPCILHHRRCGKRRRRDFHRPTLNFHKMTETAYTHARVPRQDESWDIPSIKQQVCGPISQVLTDGWTDAIFDQNISGNSLTESELMSLPRFLNSDFSNPESIALPVTPPMFTSPNFIRPLSARDQEDDFLHYGSLVEEKDRCVHHRDCNCYNSRTNAGAELFHMIDLDIVEIESH